MFVVSINLGVVGVFAEVLCWCCWDGEKKLFAVESTGIYTCPDLLSIKASTRQLGLPLGVNIA